MFSNSLEAALHYAKRGRRVLPLHSVVGGRCSCGHYGVAAPAHPHLNNWMENATTDENTIRHWWKIWPDAGVGIATGLRSGLLVVEIDGADGDRSFIEIAGEEPWARDTSIVHGFYPKFYVWYKHPDFVVPSAEIGNKLRVIGDSGFVVAPPSLDADGIPYGFIDSDGGVAPMPERLLKAVAMSAASLKEAA